MNEHDTKQPMARRPSNVIDLVSDGESSGELGSNELRRESIIEIISDEEHSDDDLEIVGESETAEPEDDDVQITGQTHVMSPAIQYPGGPMHPPVINRNPVSRSSTSTTPPTPVHIQRRNQRRRQQLPRRRGAYITDVLGPNAYEYLHSFASLPADQQVSLFHLWHEHETRDDISGSIMARLEREDELALDRKIENEKIYNRKMLQKKRQEAKENDEMHTTNISPESNLLCELCGIQLGEGIPDDFTPNPKFNAQLEKHATGNKVQAPWFCMTQCLVTDRALSKRSFVAKCGHVFCGRCIKNIGNRPAGRRTKKQEKEVSIDNPAISAPRRCPATECSHQFSRGKRAFVELFL